MKAILLEKGKEKQGARTDLLSTIDKRSDHHNTRKDLSEHLGWSTGKTAMADKVWKESEPEVIEQIKAGETSINQAYQAVKRQEKDKKRENNRIDKGRENPALSFSNPLQL